MNKRDLNENLHALADRQLEEDRTADVLAELEDNPELQAELCEIRRVKDLVRYAYPLETANEHSITSHWVPMVGKVAAALFLLVGSFSIGWYGSRYEQADPVAEQTAQNDNRKNNIIFIGYSDQQRFRETLARAESLLKASENTGSKVYVVASSGGIDMMRASATPYQKKIQQLLENYNTMHFVACNNTIYRYQQEGKPVNLVQGVEVAPSAVEFVARRIQEGWNYQSI